MLRTLSRYPRAEIALLTVLLVVAVIALLATAGFIAQLGQMDFVGMNVVSFVPR